MVLNNSQAVALAKAFSEFNNVGASLIGTIELSEGKSVTVWSDKSISVAVYKSEVECFNDQNDFCNSYSLN